MLDRIIRTSDDYAPLVARLVLGIVMFPHGAQKVLGWFGGPGLGGSMQFMHGMLHVPTLFAVLAITAEFAGSLGLILGLLGRIAAFGIGIEMVVAVGIVHFTNGFFMNWSGQQKGEGFEFHLLVIALALIVVLKGSGAFSADRALTRRRDVGSTPDGGVRRVTV